MPATTGNQNDFSAIAATMDPIKRINIGDVVQGTALYATPKMILVDLAGQFTGIISGSHLHSSIEDVSEIGVGSTVEAIVIDEDEEAGLIVLSLRKASQARLIEKLHQNFDTKEIITVIPNEANKGGLLIDLDGVKGFIPVSQLTPLHYPRVEGANAEKILDHLRGLVGKPFKVRVINVDNDGKKIIFSEKAAIEEQRMDALSKLKVGDNVEGVVSGILTYGLFVTFNGLEGLVHVSEIDWGHVSDPSKFAKVSDKVTVQVIGIEQEKISLSMKRLKTNPWEDIASRYNVGDVVTAPVVKISQFGIFLGLAGGVNGLIHLSEISHDPIENVEDLVRVGDNVEAKIIALDITSRRIGLSMKALTEAPKSAETPASEASADEEKPAKKPRATKKKTEEAANDNESNEEAAA
ncbi:MAG TPA: S1 RNA-binding domain-containing protein [bacterium]|nr:S1 RNA-binding domain-containing protein [bacterium]